MTTPSFADRFFSLLTAFGVPGDVHLVSARSQDGIRHETSTAVLAPPDEHPLWLLKLAAATGLELRVAPMSMSGRVGALWVCWTPAWVWGPSREKLPSSPAVAAIRDALRIMPRPSALVDAGGEWYAVWNLAEPITANEARPALDQLARALGAQPVGDLADVTLPVCGEVRNWDTQFIRRVDILETAGGSHSIQSLVPHQARVRKGKAS